jgi:hypothetical protein
MSKLFPPLAVLAAATTVALAGSPAAADNCPPLYDRGILGLDWQPAFVHVDRYDNGWAGSDGLTISSFRNVFVRPGQTPPIGVFENDLVARIPNIGWIDDDWFDPEIHVDQLTGDADGTTTMVWPNEAVRAPDGVFPFEAVVIPQGFHPAGGPGRLTAIDLDDPFRTEYVIHQSTQDFATGFTYPGDPNNSPRFYHRVLFIDMDGDGLDDIVTVRSGFRVVPSIYPPFSELVYFKNPGDAIDPATPWQEVVLYGGPAAGYLGPDIHLDAHDFEGDGVPEIVATHFFTGAPTAPGAPPPSQGKIAIYGAPAGGTWADVDAALFALPRVADISTDQGFPFDVQIVDLDRDGRADVLATNHQPDNCGPMTSSAVPGRVYALEPPASGRIFDDPWTTHILLDDIRPNPTPQPVTPPGRLAPGRARAFWPVRIMEYFAKPHIVVGGDEAGKVWVLEPISDDADDWSYRSSVIFDINDFYGPNATQTPLIDPFGVTISTIGTVATRYDRRHLLGHSELYIPVFEGRDIHIMSYRPRPWHGRVDCVAPAALACPAIE